MMVQPAIGRCKNCNRYIYEDPLNNMLCPHCSKGHFKTPKANGPWIKCDACGGTGDTAAGPHKCLSCQGTAWKAIPPAGR